MLLSGWWKRSHGSVVTHGDRLVLAGITTMRTLITVPIYLSSAVINSVSRRYFLQANDTVDMKDWVAALNRASKITVRHTHTHTHAHTSTRTHIVAQAGTHTQIVAHTKALSWPRVTDNEGGRRRDSI